MMGPDTPALLGGPAAFPDGPPPWPVADDATAAALRAALDDGTWGTYLGPHVPALERALAEFHAVPHALTCASGTLAVEVGLAALGVRPGDEVVLAGYDFEPNFLAVHALGALPVLVDIDPASGCLDVARFRAAVGPKVRVVVASHLHGGVVPMRELMAVAREHSVGVLEDACQATGALVQGKRAGSWGDLGALSFGGSKLLSAGRGGALLTSRPEINQRLRLRLRRGVQQWAPLSELQAAVLLPQLGRLDGANRRRAEAVRHLIVSLADVPGLRPFRPVTDDTLPAYYKLGFWFDAEKFGLDREQFVAALRAEGVAFDAGWKALHRGRGPSRYRAGGELSVAERAGERVVVLHHPVLSAGPEAIDAVARAVRKTYRSAESLAGTLAVEPPAGRSDP